MGNTLLAYIHTSHRWHQCCKKVPKIVRNWRELVPNRGLKDHTCQSDGINMSPHVCFGGIGEAHGWEVVCVVHLKVLGCLIGPHPRCVIVGIFLYSC